MTQKQADNFTLEHIFGPASFWTAETMPKVSGTPFVERREPWDPIAQMKLMPQVNGTSATQPARAGK